jgi:hypothetical protein
MEATSRISSAKNEAVVQQDKSSILNPSGTLSLEGSHQPGISATTPAASAAQSPHARILAPSQIALLLGAVP